MADINPFEQDPSNQSDNDFDPDLNIDYHQKYDNQSNIVATLQGGAIATAADFASTVWNSLPATPEISTEDMLRKVSDNALSVYEQNPDTVQAASFVAGLIAPSMVAMKGMEAARAGVKGMSWFSKAGREADLAKIEQLFSEGPTATKAYRSARNALFAKGLANNALDAIAAEAAIVGTMNAHPLMEDYMADPLKNFAISAAFGGVIGAGVGHIADRFAVRSAVGAIETRAHSTVFEELKNAYPSTNNATQLQIHEANIKTLDNIVNQTDTYDEITRQLAERTLLNVRKDQATVFDNMLSPELKALPQESKDEFMKFFAQVPEVHGVENIKFYTQKADQTVNPSKTVSGSFKDTPSFVPVKDAQGNTKIPDVIFYPEFGKYATAKDAAYYTRARDLGKSANQLDKELGKNYGIIPDNSFAEEVIGSNTASLDAKYLAALKRVDSLDSKDFAKLVVSPDDLPMMNAILSRAAKEPDAFNNIRFKVTRNAPNYNVVESEVFKQGGVKPTHIADIDKLTGRNAKYNLVDDPTLSPAAKKLLGDWVNGTATDKYKFRASVDSYLRGGLSVDDTAYKAVGEIFNSTNRKNLLEELKKHADADGNIYLWRGTDGGKVVGHSAAESYTTNYNIASKFGRPRLYKVHTDDVIGSVTDDGFREHEILVGSPARQAEATLPVQTLQSSFAKKANTINSDAGIDELSTMLLQKKEGLINDMLAQGLPIETIAIRTNVPVDTVRAFAVSPEGTALADVGITSEYRAADKIEEYLSPESRALVLQSNVNKISYSQMRANLDTKTMGDIDKELKDAFLRTSNSQGARLIGERLFGQWKPMLDIMRGQIGNFVNSKAGNKFLTSTDFFTRDMGDAGIIASTIGKNVQQISNDIERTILLPIKEHMSTIIKDQVALVEANTALNLNSSLGGYRIYKDRQFFQRQIVKNAEGKDVEQLTPVTYNGAEFKVATDSVDALLTEMQRQGRELYNMKNASHKILGKPDMSDLGFWVPAVNPKNKFIAYVHNALNDTTKLLWGNTEKELQDLVRTYSSTVPSNKLNKEIKIILPSDKEAYNILNGRNDALTMEVANTELQKRGSNSSAIIKATPDIFAELAGGYEHYIGSQTRHLAELAMSDVTDILDRMSNINQAYFKNQALGPVAKLVTQPKDTANVIKNTLLGNSNLNEYSSWRSVNQSFETGLSLGINAVGKVWDTVVRPVTKTFFGKKELTADAMQKVDYETFAKELEKQGVVNPYAVYDQEAARIFGLAQISDSPDISKRIVYAGNAFAATVALRVGELAQPIVNAMSLPILTNLAIANKMPETFMGIQKGTAKVGIAQVMYEGMRASNDPAFAKLGKMWEELGYFKPLVSEANETLALARGFDGSAITKIEKALDSNIVNFVSKPADWSETMVRRQTMYTGAVLAKRLYPELDDVGVTIFARDFMDRAVGNYHAAQRPVFFQGTAGVALGLFQTYMVTMAQNMYRSLELKNYKALAKTMLLQGTIFGGSSLPGFNIVSEAIGEHFSDNNTDLTTGTYRALGDKAADVILYGLPSNLGPALYTRGEINPRFPNILDTGLKDVVGVNFALQVQDMVSHVASALSANGNGDIGQAFGEALSMQSMSRPLARAAELATGYSVTRQGNTVQVPEEVWTATGVISRLLSTRPLEEAKLRQAMHLNSYYGAIDRDARQALIGQIKTAVRNGNITEELVAKISEEYLRKGGSPTGWRSAYNTALAQVNVNGKANLIDKLDPNSPLNFMIDNQD